MRPQQWRHTHLWWAAAGSRAAKGIKLPAALALLLRADLIGPRERPSECSLEVRVACDLSPDVADERAEPGAQNAQPVGGGG
jgi:hypothetical protein